MTPNPYAQHIVNEIALVDRHLEISGQTIFEQTERIRAKETAGQDSTLSRSLLATFLHCHELHQRHRDRLARDLSRR